MLFYLNNFINILFNNKENIAIAVGILFAIIGGLAYYNIIPLFDYSEKLFYAFYDQPFLNATAEDYISTRWLLSTYFESAGINIVSIKALHNLYKESATVKSVFRDFAANLGVLVKQFVEAEHPELIVLGGDITMSAKYFVPQLQKYLAQHNITTPIVISSLGNKSAIYGAACSWL